MALSRSVFIPLFIAVLLSFSAATAFAQNSHMPAVYTLLDEDVDKPDPDPVADCKYCKSFELESCSSGKSDVKVVEPGDDLEDLINDTSYRIYCLKPGLYNANSLDDKINITRRHSDSDKPVLIRPFASNFLKPWRSQNPLTEIPTITESFLFEGATNFVVTGIKFSPGRIHMKPLPGAPSTASQNIVLDNLLLQGSRSATQTSVQRAENVWIQNSVYRDTRVTAGDNHCIGLTGKLSRITVTNNEIFNCAGDGLQFQSDIMGDNISSVEHLIIDRNHFYLTDELYTACNNQPEDSTAICSKGENGIDIKAASTITKTIISNNVLNGFRQKEGTDWMGSAIIVHGEPSRNIEIENNVIFDTTGGISVDKQSSPSRMLIHHNLIYNFIKKGLFLHGGDSETEKPPAEQDLTDPEYLFWVNNTIKWGDNMLKNSGNHGAFFRKPVDKSMAVNNLFIGPEVGTRDTQRNKDAALDNFIGSDTNHPGSNAIFANTFVNAGAVSNQTPDKNLVYKQINLAQWFDQYCFTVKPLTAPQQECIQQVVPKKTAPFVGKANPALLRNHPSQGDVLAEAPLLPQTIGDSKTPGFIDPQ